MCRVCKSFPDPRRESYEICPLVNQEFHNMGQYCLQVQVFSSIVAGCGLAYFPKVSIKNTVELFVSLLLCDPITNFPKSEPHNWINIHVNLSIFSGKRPSFFTSDAAYENWRQQKGPSVVSKS